jgi:acyl-coenzyme A synthetase/AMP-(fatty) acid ligase
MKLNKNFNKFIEELKDNGQRVAIIDRGISYSYYDLHDQINFYVVQLESRQIQNKIVYLHSDYSFKAISLFFALAHSRNIIVPVVSENLHERNQRMDILNPDYVLSFCNTGDDVVYAERKANNIERHPLIRTLFDSGHPGVVLFSSGTTGKPKAMIHDLNSLLAVFLGKRKRSLNFVLMLLFDHIGGLNTLFNCLSMGSTVVVPEQKTPESISSLIEEYKVNILPSSPTFLNLILIGKYYERYSFDSVKLITYGTERMSQALLTRLKDIFPGTKFLQTFGTSETGIATTISESSNSTFFKIDETNQEYKIVNSELWLRSKTQIKGYINSSNDSFTDDGWFKTGDIVEVKGEFLRIRGRKNEIINVGGQKVIPSEIENTILELEGIIDCTVKGESNPLTGQIVVAEIITNKSDRKKAKLEIKNHCRYKLESYKVPVKIKFIEALEHTDRFKKR